MKLCLSFNTPSLSPADNIPNPEGSKSSANLHKTLAGMKAISGKLAQS
jgi:hypothetical protein